LKNDLFCLKGQGTFSKNFAPESLSVSFLLPHLSRLAANLGGIASGNIHYDGTIAQIEVSSESLEVGETIYTGVRGNLETRYTTKGWNGSAQIQALHPSIPLEGKSVFTFKVGSFLDLKDLYLKAPETQMTGDLRLSFPDTHYEGALLVQAQNLSHFAPLLPGSKLAGKLAGKLNFHEQTAHYYGVVQDFQCFEMLAKEIRLEGSC